MNRFRSVFFVLLSAVSGVWAVGPGDGWRLAAQAYTFRAFTFFETIDILDELGIRYVEAYPGQAIGGGIDGKVRLDMPAADEAKVKAKLAARDVRLVAFGVTDIPGKEPAARAFFENAKRWGIEILHTEVPAEQVPLLDRLAGEVDMRIGIHNHPKESRYWHPDRVLDACEGLSDRIGSCSDTGHWVRSGLDPVAGLKRVGKRVISLHIKDVNEARRDVPWGTGISDMDGQLNVLHRQGFKGILSIEYEHQSPQLVEDVAKCVAFFRTWTPSAATPTAVASASQDVFGDEVSVIWKRLEVGGVDGRWPPPSERLQNLTPGAAVLDDGRLITANGQGFPREGPQNAFDGKPSKYCNRGATMWLQVEYPDGPPPAVRSYAIQSANDAPKRDPRDWQVLGSQDGETWVVLDDRRGEAWTERHETRFFLVENAGAYTHVKLDVTANHGDVSSQMSEWRLMDRIDPSLFLPPLPAEDAPMAAAGIGGLAQVLAGFEPLLDADLANTTTAEPDAWTWEQGVLSGSAKGTVWTRERYADFVLDFEFRCTSAGADGGVLIRCPDTADAVATALEIQIIQRRDVNPDRVCGAVVGCVAPAEQTVRLPGAWNHCTILAKGRRLCVVLNGTPVVDMDMTAWTEPGKNPDGSGNPLRPAIADLALRGLIGLQCWTSEVAYRAVRIKPLD